MINGIYNVSDFVAQGDGVTDVGPAFYAAMEAMGPVTVLQSRHGTVFIPAGDYWFAEDFEIERALKLVGVGPGGYQSKIRLIFALYKGVRVYSQDPRDGNDSYAAIKYLNITTMVQTIHHVVLNRRRHNQI